MCGCRHRLTPLSLTNVKMKQPLPPPLRLATPTLLRRSMAALVALLVLLLSLPQRVAAQGCPTLDTGDFTATLIAANSDCHTPARLSVVYRNAVAGFTAMTYSVSKNRTTWGTPVVTPRPGSEAVLPLDGWNEGDPIYIRATATCGTQQPRVVLPKIVYHVKTSADVLATPVVTPAGGCEATSGAVSVSLTGVSGFSRVQYKLERDPVRAGQQAVPVGNLTARSPYQQTLFFNLSPGRYTLHVRATPNCTPTAPGAAWKDGAYEWEQPVDVEHFSVIPTPILTRGTCPGGVTIDVAKVVGIGGLRYEIWKKGQRATGAPALQTATVTYPAFTHTFTGLPLGDYEVRATSIDCEARATSSFSVTAGALVQPQVTIIRHTYAGCAAGQIEVAVEGTTAACPVSYTLTPAAGGTPQVRSNVTTERTQFTGLAAGTYTLTTSYGGQTMTTPVEIKTVTPGTLKVEPSPADVYCSPTGRMKVTLEGGTLDEPATLTLSLNGTAVRSVNLNAGETTKQIDDLLPGAYSLALRTECGATAEAETAIAAKNVPSLLNQSLMFYVENFDFCSPKPLWNVRVDFQGYGITEADIHNALDGASYEVYSEDGKLLANGPIPADQLAELASKNRQLSFYIKVPPTDGSLSFIMRPSCGDPVLFRGNGFLMSKQNEPGSQRPKLEKEITRLECNKTHVKFYLQKENEGNGIVKIKDKTTGALVAETKSMGAPLYTTAELDLPNGDYICEYWVDCPDAPHYTEPLHLDNLHIEPTVNVSDNQLCTSNGSISLNYYQNYGETSTFLYNDVKHAELRDASGVLLKEITARDTRYTFDHLGAGTYTVKVAPVDPGSCLPAFTKTVEIKEYEIDYPGSTPPGQPSPAFPFDEDPPGVIPYKDRKSYRVETGATADDNTLKIDFYAPPGDYKFVFRNAEGTVIQTKTITNPDTGQPKSKFTAEFNHLPDYVEMDFPTQCGTHCTEKLYLTALVPKTTDPLLDGALNVTPINAVPGCQDGKLLVTSRLVANGAPQKPTRIAVYAIKYTTPSAPATYTEVESTGSTGIITEWISKSLPMGGYQVYYYYGEKRLDAYAYINISSALPLYSLTSATPPGQKGILILFLNSLSPNDRVRVRFIDPNSGAVKSEEIRRGGKSDSLRVAPGNYRLEVEGLNGCYMGQVYTQDVSIPEAQLQLTVNTNTMQCANDGKITIQALKGYGTVDQINYEIVPPGGGASINGQTTTPEQPKEFPGLAPGSYTIKATGVVLRGFDGQPHSYESTNYTYLSSSYQTLVARSAPYAGKASYACGNSGGVGLYTDKGSLKRLKVYVTETPSGPVHPRRELTKNTEGRKNYDDYAEGWRYTSQEQTESHLTCWGNDLAPGTYKLFVTDGCTDIEIPNAEVKELEDKARFTGGSCVTIETKELNSNVLSFRLDFDFRDLPEAQRKGAYLNYEVQVTPPGTAPDEHKWSHGGSPSYDYNSATFVHSRARFDLSGGYDVYYRLIGCPATMKHVHLDEHKLCNPFRLSTEDSKCNETKAKLTEYDTGHPYRIVVVRTRDNQTVYDQVKTLVYKSNFPPQLADELVFPSNENYQLTITSQNEEMDPYIYMLSSRSTALLLERKAKRPATCRKIFYDFYTQGDCFEDKHTRVIDKATGATVLDAPHLSDLTGDAARNFPFERNKEYTLQYVEADGTTTNHMTWKAEYVLPNAYAYDNIQLGGSCDSLPPKTAGAHSELSRLLVDWEAGSGDKVFEQIKQIVVRNTATGKTYVALDFSGDPTNITYSNTTRTNRGYLSPSAWSEVRAPGDTVRNVTPELEPGTYALEVRTACNNFTSSFTVTYKPPLELKVKIKNVKIDCDGKITFTPTGTAKFPDTGQEATFQNYTLDSDPYTYLNWGDPVETYKPKGQLNINLTLPNGNYCTRQYTYDIGYEPLAFDRANTVSFFCAGAHSGQINVALKGGHKPYIYELRTLDGTLVEKKSAHGAVTFEQGSLGSRYRIEATDSCGLTHVHQDVLLQDPAAISGSITDRISVCDGDPVRIKAVKFPGATYTWTLPDGTHSHDQELSFVGTPDKAGKYTVDIQLNTCNATITGNYTLRVGHLAESAGTHTQRTCAGQSAVFAPADPVATLNGQPADQEDLEFQWQYTKTPTDANSWKPIFGATEKSVEYVAAYPGTYYLRRTTRLGDCVAVGGLCTLTVDPGITVTMSASERRVVIDHKNPFLLTAGLITGPAARTYVWQRSLDGKTWTDVGTDVSYTETQRLAPVVYYRRIIRSGTCETKGEPITVIFKRRYPAMVNPQLRQRVDQHW